MLCLVLGSLFRDEVTLNVLVNERSNQCLVGQALLRGLSLNPREVMAAQPDVDALVLLEGALGGALKITQKRLTWVLKWSPSRCQRFLSFVDDRQLIFKG